MKLNLPCTHSVANMARFGRYWSQARLLSGRWGHIDRWHPGSCGNPPCQADWLFPTPSRLGGNFGLGAAWVLAMEHGAAGHWCSFLVPLVNSICISSGTEHCCMVKSSTPQPSREIKAFVHSRQGSCARGPVVCYARGTQWTINLPRIDTCCYIAIQSRMPANFGISLVLPEFCFLLPHVEVLGLRGH